MGVNSVGNNNKINQVNQLKQQQHAQKPQAPQFQTQDQFTLGGSQAAATLVNAGNSNGVLNAQQATTLAQNLDSLDSRQRNLAKQQIANTFTRDPSALDSIMSNGSAAEKQAVARATFNGFVRHGQQDPTFANTDNYTRITKMAEAIDPNASGANITRALRQCYYGDDELQIDKLGLNVGFYKADVSQELEDTLSRANLKNSWQEITGPDGNQMDISHSLVALDAYNSSPGFGGYLKSELFTDVGDLGTSILSAINLRNAGDMNMRDTRGNAIGSRLVGNAIANNSSQSLSQMLQQGLRERMEALRQPKPDISDQTFESASTYAIRQQPTISTKSSNSAKNFEDDWWSAQGASKSDLDDDF